MSNKSETEDRSKTLPISFYVEKLKLDKDEEYDIESEDSYSNEVSYFLFNKIGKYSKSYREEFLLKLARTPAAQNKKLIPLDIDNFKNNHINVKLSDAAVSFKGKLSKRLWTSNRPRIDRRLMDGIVREINLEEEYILIEAKLTYKSNVKFTMLNFPFSILEGVNKIKYSDVISFIAIIDNDGFVKNAYVNKVYPKNISDRILIEYFETMMK